ncbi:MAG: bactofilin family protein [Pseudomarimonas sp.]
MSLWKDTTPKPAAAPTPAPAVVSSASTQAMDVRDLPRQDSSPKAETTSYSAPPRATDSSSSRKESLIASDITIEGKIEGTGSVRIAGVFKGDVNVQGDLMIESGAKVTGSVRADKVIVAGELEGNIDGASRVDLQQGGAIVGDVKAGSLTVAAGARMRGNAVFGWDEGTSAKSGKSSGGGNKADFSSGA